MVGVGDRSAGAADGDVSVKSRATEAIAVAGVGDRRGKQSVGPAIRMPAARHGDVGE